MSNGFTDEQTALIERVAWTVGDKIGIQFEKRIDEKVALHAAKCPTALKVHDALSQAKGGWKSVTVGAAIVITLASLAVAIFK